MRGQGLDAYQGAGQKLQCTPWSPRPQEGAKDRVQRERPGRDVLMGGVSETLPQRSLSISRWPQLHLTARGRSPEWRFGCPQHSAVRNSRDTAWSTA